jgi:RNA polymerase sigma-70 factor (ECF subfamily)
MRKPARTTMLRTWQEVKFRTGPGWVVASETFANREVGGRAYREKVRPGTGREAGLGQVLAACLRSNYPPRAPRRKLPLLTNTAIPLGALAQISYAAFMRETTDEQLMHRYAKGDAKAFDQLYARHRSALYRYFNRQVSNTATANDLYQGAWEKIIKARSRYRSSAPFTAWMYRIAHNHLVDHYRRLRPDDSMDTDVLSDHQPGPAEGVIGGEQTEHLRAGITALPEEQRNTLLLKLETGLKMEEIATVTGVSRETVKSRLRYAVNKLKRSLVE